MDGSAEVTRRHRVAWYLYDFGNSAYTSVVLLAVYPVYFKDQVVGGAEGTRLWGYAVFLAMLVVAILAPILGALADHTASKKRQLLFFTTLSCVCTAGLYGVVPGAIALGMGLFILAEIGYRGGQVFYDALLPEVATPEQMGRVSGIGWAVGTGGGVLVLLILQAMGRIQGAPVSPRIAVLITACFFSVGAAALFIGLPERAQALPLPPGRSALGVAWEQVRHTVRTARQHAGFLKFMLAFVVFNNGVIMVLDFAGILGSVVYGLTQQDLIRFFIVVQLANVAGAFGFGWVADRWGVKPALTMSLLSIVAVALSILVNHNPQVFYVMGLLAGVGMAGAQSLSRTLVALLAPPAHTAEFFGFYSMAARVSSVLGPGIYGWLAAEGALHYAGQADAEVSGHRIACLAIAGFVLAGLALLVRVAEPPRRRKA